MGHSVIVNVENFTHLSPSHQERPLERNDSYPHVNWRDSLASLDFCPHKPEGFGFGQKFSNFIRILPQGFSELSGFLLHFD